MNRKIVFAVGCLTGGGTERVISTWSSQLAERGVSTYIITHYRSPDEYSVDEKVHFMPVGKDEAEYLKMSKQNRLMRTRQIIKAINPDYLISFLPSMQILISLASVGLKTKRIETVRNNPWITEDELGWAKEVLWKRCFRTANKIIVQGAGQAEFFNRRYQSKIRIVRNPISNDYLLRPQKTYTSSVTEFIAVGRIDEQKNYPLMIKAFARACSINEHIHLRIYGRGSETYTKQIAALIADAGMTDRIFLMGRSNCIEKQYQSSDAFLLTSDYEGMPNVLAEAMASGLVCISSDCKTGPADLIDDGENGFLFNCGDEDRLTELILSVCSMPKESLTELGARAKDKVNRTCNLTASMESLCTCFDESIR